MEGGVKTVRHRWYKLTDERLLELVPVAEGGFVIFPNGLVAAVEDCGHYRVLNRHPGWDGSYHAAYQDGAIRISFCGKHVDFWVELYDDKATLKSLQSLRRMMRHYATKTERTRFKMTTKRNADALRAANITQASGVVTKIIQRRMVEAQRPVTPSVAEVMAKGEPGPMS